MSSFENRVWFITGTSTGLGRAVAELVLEKGEIVVATARSPARLDDLAQRYHKERLLVLPLDVNKPQQIIDAFAEAAHTFGRIDVVFNNAGKGDVGEFEGMEEATARSMLETNFWDAVSVTKEALKCFRETNPPGVGGRLLQMSSYAGLVGLAATSIYSAAKFDKSHSFTWQCALLAEGGIFCLDFFSIALEGVSEALAAELDPEWNIKVTVIEPGFIRTGMGAKATWAPAHPAYQNPALPSTYVRKIGWNTAVTSWKDTNRSAEAFYKIACVPNPPLHFLVGKDAIEGTRKKIAALLADIETYEALSEGLEE